MMIRHVIGEGVILVFPKSERLVVLTILRVLYKANQQDFLKEAIEGIEAEDTQKALPMVNYFHLCQRCFRDLDERDANSIHYIKDNNEKWFHRDCLPLKNNRPV